MVEQSELYLEKDDFIIWTPGEVGIIEKGENTSSKYRRIGGITSTEARDRQREVVVQKGLDFSEFVKHGYYNDNHRQDTDAVVGVPELARYKNGQGWYTEGYLLKTKLADRIWDLAKALEETPRRLGFSVEGKVVERGDGNRILRALIRNVALTNRPVNTDCSWNILSKAFASNDEIEECHSHYLKRALSSGYGKVAGGGAIKRQDMDLKKRKTTHDADEDESDEISKGMLIRRGMKSPDEALDFLKLIRPQYSDTVRERIVNLAIKMKEA